MIGKRLHFIRKQKKLTQDALAEAASKTRGQISLYECDRLVPDLSTVVKIADALGVSVDYLLGRSDEPGIFKPHVEPEPAPDESAGEVFSPEQVREIEKIVGRMMGSHFTNG